MRKKTDREKQQAEQQVFDALRDRWLDRSMPKGKKMNEQPSWFVKCPQCNHGGARMGIAKNHRNHVLLCPTCMKCYPLGSLVKHYAPDLAETLWGPGKGTISGRARGKGASDADERKRWAQERRTRFLSAPADSADPFGNSEGL